MKPLTKQEVFDAVYRHVKRDGRLGQGIAKDGSVMCYYRGPEGQKCVAGALIPDKKYMKKLENKSVQRIMHKFPGVFPEMQIDAEYLLSRLQYEHDNSDSVESLLERLKLIAKEHKLTIPTI